MNTKTPMRKCVGCGAVRPKNDMIRIGTGPDGPERTENGIKVAGRGAYVCVDQVCLCRARERGSLSRALSEKVPDELFDTLIKEIVSREIDKIGQHKGP